jgi:hypothetical protein
MVQSGGCARLPLKAFHLIPGAGPEKFHCDLAAEARIFGAVNDPHAATAKLVENSIV